MNLTSCKGCGNVIDLKYQKLIIMQVPQDPTDDTKDGNYTTFETMYNPNVVWGYREPLDTWQCIICNRFNGIKTD